MDILKKLKTEKKEKNDLLSSIIKKDTDEEKKPEVDNDITQLNNPPKVEEKVVFREERVISRPKTFSTDGIREFTLDSLSPDETENVKMEYAKVINNYIIEGRLDEALELLTELKNKLKKS